ncbi:hypothetical protein RND71_008398 [Anisodus tanguticus]|uniref:Protein FAR1-RELATED SEQUENCE n=1 Tax=Anisodus tanguticus TaxID=243964 RepID=A0AAE1VTS0_9SOLA|nr:hypothetical protein RND71_008398 [Anisodus tanguticus]
MDGRYKAEKNEFKSNILGRITTEEFEHRWGEFIEKYGQEGIDWFSKLYSDRENRCQYTLITTSGMGCYRLKEVMEHKKTKLFNERYVLTRWSKDVVRHHLKKFILGGYPHMTDEYKKYKELMRFFDEACNIALDSDIMVQFARSRLLDLLNNLYNFDHDMIQEVTQKWGDFIRT